MTSDMVSLNDGRQIPRIAYGSGTAWFKATGPDGISPELVQATKQAIEIGYRHLDAAKFYGNELSTGAAVSQCGVPREKLFITTKILSGLASIKENLKTQLEELCVDYVDLYLIHSPVFSTKPDEPTLAEAWQKMEELQKEGSAKSIGVSNYRISDLKEILKSAKVKPAVNQIEFHPYVWKEAEPLLKFMNQEGIALEAYGSQVPVVKLPGGRVDQVLERLSSQHKISTGEVLLKWAKAHGAIIVTTSSKPSRMKSMLQVVLEDTKDLSQEQVQELNAAGIENGVQRVFMKHSKLTSSSNSCRVLTNFFHLSRLLNLPSHSS